MRPGASLLKRSWRHGKTQPDDWQRAYTPRMPIALAYIAVVLIWGTTPFAISVSNALGGFGFALFGRMLLGWACVGAALVLLRIPLPRTRAALSTYLAAGTGLFVAMALTYWAALRIPSGWMSVVFGLSPLWSAIWAAALMNQRRLPAICIGGLLCGVAGLAMMFASGVALGPRAIEGLAGILLASAVHAGAGVMIQRLRAGVHALAQVFGGLTCAMPGFFCVWLTTGARLPDNLELAAGAGSQLGPWFAFLYLAVVATTFGFSLYYFLLSRLSAVRVALITLITPGLGLGIGAAFGGEPLTMRVLAGAGLIVVGLAVFEFGAWYTRQRPLTAVIR